MQNATLMPKKFINRSVKKRIYGPKTARSSAAGTKSKRARARALMNRRLAGAVQRIDRMIETKQSNYYTASNVSLPHNNVVILNNSGGTPLNIFQLAQGLNAPESGVGSRIGDQVAMKGVTLKFFLENALGRAKVWYRVMLLRGAKGQVFDRSTIFCGDAANKMLDVVDTRKFQIVWSQTFSIHAQGNGAAITNTATGEPRENNISGDVVGGQGTKLVEAYIPGSKFKKKGIITYEVGSQTQVKWFDYRIAIVAYDWFGTPQDANNVGKLNEFMYKMYYKDA